MDSGAVVEQLRLRVIAAKATRCANSTKDRRAPFTLQKGLAFKVGTFQKNQAKVHSFFGLMNRFETDASKFLRTMGTPGDIERG
jgi:hypothetical protein